MENVKEVLRESIFEVFERMFFIFLEPGGRSPAHDFETSIRFDGVPSGTIRLLFTRPLASLMVHNMLGTSGNGVTQDQITDCLKEAANMVCGNFLVNLDASKRFTMSIPDFSSRPRQVEDGAGERHVFDLDSEAGKLSVCLQIEK